MELGKTIKLAYFSNVFFRIENYLSKIFKI